MNKKRMIIGILILVILVAACFWYFYFFMRGVNPPLPRGTLTIDGHAWSVELATTMKEQALGLSNREGLGENDGMLFVFATSSVQSFWMKDMNFPLDMIWISGNTVAGFAQNAVPQPGAQLWQLTIYASPAGVNKVLEVPAGTVAQYSIKAGDAVTFSD